MSPRFNLDEAEPSGSNVISAGVLPRPPLANRRQLAVADWDPMAADQLVLFVADEPLIGDEFSYNGVRWQVVDYRDGWIARILL